MKKITCSLFLLLAFVAGCSLQKTMPADSETAQIQSGIELENFDLDVRPQDDFYRYVNGTWLKNTKIPADKSNFGVFTILADKANQDVLEIIKSASASKHSKPGSNEQKVGDFYNSFMDTAKLDQLGIGALTQEVKKIDAISSPKQLAEYFAYASKIGSDSPLAFFINNDPKQPNRYIASLVHTGLGLPDRDYYVNDSVKYLDIRKTYQDHIAKMFELAGWEDPAQSASTVLNIETELAKAHWTKTERRDRDKTYNKFSIQDLNQLVKNFDWQAYLTESGLQNEKEIIVRTPSFYLEFSKILKNTSLQDWKTYQRWQLLNSFANLLSEDFDNLNFVFYGTELSGQEAQKARWERGVQLVNSHLGEIIGEEYVAKHFSPESKERMTELVENLRKAYHDSILELDWMSEGTKQQAIKKLEKFTPKIGYPDKWQDYSSLNVTSSDLVGNVIASNQFAHNFQVNKLGKPIDRKEWFMTPQTVNAYYNPSMNEIVFPAAILQPPFFNLEAEDAVNYGAIGGVIGHEMGHGFDDQGAKSDGDGLLSNWWTDQDLQEFKTRTQKLVGQFNQYEPLPGEHVNGELTLGENIGDLGGVTIAHKAYFMSLEGQNSPTVDGFTGEQRFFIGWAQVWPRKYREQELSKRLTVDPHSPSEYRVNGVVRNMPEFYKAFDVEPSDKLYLPPNERVKIW